jgi:hemerythrin
LKLKRALDVARRGRAQARRRLATLEHAWRRFVPERMLQLLNASNIAEVKLGDRCERKLSIAFCDIRDFTTISEGLTPSENFEFLNAFLGQVEPAIVDHGGVVDKYIGDAIMALYPTDPDAAVQGSLAMFERLESFNAPRVAAGLAPVRIAVGINTGFVMLGAVGASDRIEATVISDSVNLASRLQTATKLYGASLIIGEHTLNGLVDPSAYAIRFLDRIRVKGKVHPQSIYEVLDVDSKPRREAKLATRAIFERGLALYHLREVAAAVPLLEACCRLAPFDTAAHLYLGRCQAFLSTGEHTGTGEAGAVLEWRKEYDVGVDIIDEQHRELLRQMNALSHKVRHGDTHGTRAILGFLGEYAVEHFRTEETLMAQTGYPLAQEHIQEHVRFVERFTELAREVEAGTHEPLSLLFRVQLGMIDWVITHTTGTDQHLGNFLRERGVHR